MGLKDTKKNLVFNASRDWKPMEMFLDVRGDMGVTGKSGNEYFTAAANRSNMLAYRPTPIEVNG